MLQIDPQVCLPDSGAFVKNAAGGKAVGLNFGLFRVGEARRRRLQSTRSGLGFPGEDWSVMAVSLGVLVRGKPAARWGRIDRLGFMV